VTLSTALAFFSEMVYDAGLAWLYKAMEKV
jgi:hypothetical protein